MSIPKDFAKIVRKSVSLLIKQFEVMKYKVDKFICPNCGLQEAVIDENGKTRCPKCNKVVQLASPDKEWIRISKPQKNQ